MLKHETCPNRPNWLSICYHLFIYVLCWWVFEHHFLVEDLMIKQVVTVSHPLGDYL